MLVGVMPDGSNLRVVVMQIGIREGYVIAESPSG